MNASTLSQPIYTVTGIKSFRGREGFGFNTTLHCNGRKVAHVDDDASGGMLGFHWLDKARAKADRIALEQHIATLPPLATEYGEIKMDADLFVSELVNDAENAKRFKRILADKIIFTLPAKSGLRQIKLRPTAEGYARVMALHPDANIINTKPLPEAMALLSGAA